MAWATPKNSRTKVNNAGRRLLDVMLAPEKLNSALQIVNNWRASHSFPLNTFQVGLRRRAKQVDRNALVAQRIKRLSSIEAKLIRFKNLQLSDMQDLGGCRAIVRSTDEVYELLALYLTSDIKHKLDDMDDYIATPKKSGYRSVHLIYRYYSDKKTTYNGLKIEIQLRSQLQHAWATAVETVGTFIKQALKSSQGQKEWLRFFALMSTYIAFKEGTEPVPNTPTDKKILIEEIQKLAQQLDVVHRLQTYGAALKTLENPNVEDAHFFLMKLDPATEQVTVTGYKSSELQQASDEYLALEKEITDQPGADAVLVSVESIEALRRAYPNYFLDTTFFVKTVVQALEG